MSYRQRQLEWYPQPTGLPGLSLNRSFGVLNGAFPEEYTPCWCRRLDQEVAPVASTALRSN